MDIKQNKNIYLVMGVVNSNNTLDSDDIDSCHMTEAEALTEAKDITEEHGLKTYVFECTPIIMCRRGELRIIRLKKGGK